MATIRFIREDLEVQCNPGENLRELVMKENLQLYGLKGILGNCGGAGQCSICFISVLILKSITRIIETTSSLLGAKLYVCLCNFVQL